MVQLQMRLLKKYTFRRDFKRYIVLHICRYDETRYKSCRTENDFKCGDEDDSGISIKWIVRWLWYCKETIPDRSGFCSQRRRTVKGTGNQCDVKFVRRLCRAFLLLQVSGEPGDDQAVLRVRGSIYNVTYIVDGMPRSINDIDPNDIESVSVLKMELLQLCSV
ncbi:Plug domain-containing protein [Bacteroides thetaiotaomicron]|nr:Plug domain-containing protein [Bacteroides thetaiotaomicron]